jgi:hypothetical protein
MQLRRSLARFTPVAALIPALALAACGDSATGPDRLTRDEVGGVYEICTLTFTPSPPFSSADAVDMLSTIDAPSTARLELSKNNDQFGILFRPRDGGVTRTLNGSYQLGPKIVTANFGNAADARATFLLPPRLLLEFQASPKELATLANSQAYTVPRADFERVSGKKYPNARDEIEGTLSARFTAGPCSSASPTAH